MDKVEQLRQVLERLSPQQAGALVASVELQRALGKEALPSDMVLDGLRPALRRMGARRVPTLRRLIAAGFEEFLTDRCDEPRLEGLIPRSSIPPWWAAVRRIAGGEADALERRLREQLAAAPAADLETLRQEAQSAAARWSAAIVAELAKHKPDATLRRLLPGALSRDVDVIAHILAVAEPLAAAMKALTRLAARLGMIEGQRIADLAPDCVTLLKQQYLALSESHGMEARFLALAVLNRLVQPRQILRLGRALSWKPSDTLVSSTEFSCIGERLIGEVQRLARNVLVQLPERNGPLPAARGLAAALAQYLEQSEGMLAEIGLRRDSPWGAAMLKTRAAIADALDPAFLDRFAQQALAVLPLADSGDCDLGAAPSPDTIAEAVDAVRFLRLLLKRGERHARPRDRDADHAALRRFAAQAARRAGGGGAGEGRRRTLRSAVRGWARRRDAGPIRPRAAGLGVSRIGMPPATIALIDGALKLRRQRA